MNNQEILEGNKLIAEFLGFEFKNGITQNEVFYTLEKEHPIYLQGYSYKCAKFHSSWDWLMPVVEKIQNLYRTSEYFGALINISTTHISISCADFNYCDSKPQKDWEPFDIIRVWKAVIEFIKWYNKNKKL